MIDAAKQIVVLGSTGSIGTSAVEVLAAGSDRLKAFALSAHGRFERLEAQARRLKPQFVIATDVKAAAKHSWQHLPENTELLTGHTALEQVVADQQVNLVLAAIVGSAGLRSTWAALEARKTVALANKETLVMAGPLVRRLLDRSGGTLMPVDSEHSALFQALQAGRRVDVRRVVLTASGGPFRTWASEQMTQVTIDEALAHPTWNMGPKITVDSATMMNKALEIIEARWLFDLDAGQIDVMIHPQSMLHGLVEFVDGSVIAQLSPPDMKLPIQYALHYPDRVPGIAERVDWTLPWKLELEPPDMDRFPALELGFACARSGGTSGAVLNAANEAAVGLFLDGELHFTEIVPACKSVLEMHPFEPNPSLERLVQLDRWARQEVSQWVCA